MAKKKLPKVLALLDEDMCTGCEACMTVCPVDCIHIIPGPRHEVVFQVCTIDLPRCIGCTLCHQVCPWDCIYMLAPDIVADGQSQEVTTLAQSSHALFVIDDNECVRCGQVTTGTLCAFCKLADQVKRAAPVAGDDAAPVL